MHPSAGLSLILLLRHLVDSPGIYGFGLYLTGTRLKRARLLRLALFGALFITPVRFLPVSMGTQVSLVFLVMTAVLMGEQGGMILDGVGAVLAGGWALMVLEWAVSTLLGKFGFPVIPAVIDPLRAVLITTPPALLLAGLALFLQQLPQSNQESPAPGGWEALIVPTAELVTVMIVSMTLPGAPLYHAIPEWTVRLLPFVVFVLIIHQAKRPEQTALFIPPHLLSFAVEVLDLLLIPVIIFLIVEHTGGTTSPYRLLYLPFIATNALKQSSIPGLWSLVFGTAAVIIPGLLGGNANLEVDLIYTGSFVLAFYLIRQLAHTLDVLSLRASIDDLTGLFNYRFLHSHLERLLGDKQGKTFSIMLDLDNFKDINDTMGHPVGDMLLRKITQDLKQAVREDDVLARCGGDEFVVIPRDNITEDNAISLAYRISEAVKDSCRTFLASPEKQLDLITASVGIACTTDRDRDALIAAADQALYLAKSGGKNRTVAAWDTDGRIMPARR